MRKKLIKAWAAATLILSIIAAVVVFSGRTRSSEQTAQSPLVTSAPEAPANLKSISKPGLPLAQPYPGAVSQAPLGSQVASWTQSIREPKFAPFADWALRYTQALNATDKANLQPEGRELALARRQAMVAMIQSDPKRALELAVPAALRQALPDSIKSLLEEPVNTRGDYEVICVLPLPGHEPGTPILRMAKINGDACQVFTYGKALEYVTRKDVPLQGIALTLNPTDPAPANAYMKPGKLMALDPTPARLLGQSELEAFKVTQLSEPICAATGLPWSSQGQPTALQVGGQIYPFSSLALAEAWAATNSDIVALDVPQVPDNLPTAESSYTEGRKRFLLMRVDFPDYAGERMTTNQALTLMADMGAFMSKISYGKHFFAPVGQGTDITPTMRMSQNASYYDNGGLSLLYPEAKDVARTNFGYDLTQYDFLFVVTAGQPSYGYAGLGYVGGVGFHLANSYWDVRTGAHEFGHNLGLSHANWWDTGGKSMIGAGSNEEYGDTFDTMGISGGGNYHFSSYNKNRVGWIPNTDCPVITRSGIYRLYAQDTDIPVGTRGLRMTHSGGDYWVEFRQLWTGNKALMNGVSLRWVSGSTELLDTTPGSSSGKNDHPLTIGRTFADSSLGLYITPVGKGNTYPESMDVVVNLGTFPTNKAPIVVVNASATQASTGQGLTFTAAATDPNNDPLAYFWDFGDANYSVDNEPVTTHSFSSAGEYVVGCTVSDMKGGTAIHSITVRIGTPTTYSISGRVLTTNGLPVTGIKMSVDASHYAFTESDGTYTISRLAAGSYTVSAREPVTDTLQMVTPFFQNPISLGPNFTSADFLVWPNPLQSYTTIVSTNSTWKYLDNGSNQGTNWITPTFNDTGWSNGVGILGYGEDNETTILSYGTDSNNKYITYYFRRQFNLPDPTAYTNLLLQTLIDDGVVVYINGTEVYRYNMPAGTVNYLTLASAAIEPDAYLSTNLPPNLFVAGANTIAAEVHQANGTSSDLNFDLALSGTTRSNVPGLNMVYLSKPESYQTFTTPTNITLSATALSGGSTVTLVEFFDENSKIGDDTTAPYSQVLTDPALGLHTLRAVATLNNGLRLTSAPVAITITLPAPAPLSLSLVETGAYWKYLATATGAPPGWASLTYNDASWPGGLAKLGYGETDTVTVIPYGGNAASKWITSYYRRTFSVVDPGAITTFNFRLLRDDGAIVYLNGREVFRSNMPGGTVNYLTTASTAVSGADEFTYFVTTLAATNLVTGTNVLAVEIHQSSGDSSDVSFDIALDVAASANRPRGAYLTLPEDGTTIKLPGNVTLAADVVAGGTLGVTGVWFFSDDVALGSSLTAPASLVWSNPPAGQHIIYALATDTAGDSITSAPITITVTPPPVETAFISFGELWKYLDDGSNQGTNWSSRTFDDRAWQSGPARLGYGGDGEITTINYGTNSYRYVGAYFRKTFTTSTPWIFNGLLLRLVRDDGAVVFLNGTEIYRNNLAPGLVSWNSLATATVNAPEETTPIDVVISPISGLRVGTNVIAVELHQSSATSSDAGFDMALFGLKNTNTAQGIYLVSPADASQYNTPAVVQLNAFAASTNGPVTLVEFYDGEVKLAEAATYPYVINWSAVPSGVHTLSARATYGEGLSMTSAPVTIIVGNSPAPITPVMSRLITPGSTWKYWDNIDPVDTGWQQTGFDDSPWPAAPARFGWGLDGEITPLTEGRITHYFRRWFTVTNPAVLTELTFGLVRDDGAVVYLNGVEIFRSNMPAGPIGSSTLASSTVNTPDETTYFETVLPTAGSGLMIGSNLVAVELHQGSSTSSDAGFDLQLSSYGTTEARVYLSTPSEGASFVSYSAINLQAQAWPGAGATVSKVEFFVDGEKLGECLAAPWRLSWDTPVYGQHSLTARSTDNHGNMLDSAPVHITVSPQGVALTLVPTDAVWRYLDNGSNQGTNWAQTEFNDSAWASGPARLGYGGDGEVTTVSYGPNAGAKYITTYFRRAFVMPPGAVLTNLVFRLLRDDGAVVWLNGREIYRANMPVGAVNYLTGASTAVAGADEQTFFATNRSATGIVLGTNILAVEIHQNNGTSSDLSFNLELVAEGYVNDDFQPTLDARIVDGSLELSWPSTALNFRLYSSDGLQIPAPGWTPSSSAPVTVNWRNITTVPCTNRMQVFRLGRP